MNLSVMLREACGFLNVGKGLLNTLKNPTKFFGYYFSPCAVNLAFACEVFLKYLYAAENNGKEYGHYHGLLDIYNDLSKVTQEKIRSFYEVNASVLSFDDCFKCHNKSFLEIRYMYEGKNKIQMEPQSLFNMAVALHNMCIDITQQNALMVQGED